MLAMQARGWYLPPMNLIKALPLCVLACFACTPAQRDAEAAKAEACLRQPEVIACVIQVAGHCAEVTCTHEERARENLICLKPCRESHSDGGAGGLSGEGGAQ